jgi:hypothetical protein
MTVSLSSWMRLKTRVSPPMISEKPVTVMITSAAGSRALSGQNVEWRIARRTVIPRQRPLHFFS